MNGGLAHGELAHGDALNDVLVRKRELRGDGSGKRARDDALDRLGQHARTLVGKCPLQRLQLKLRTMSNKIKKRSKN